MVARRRLRRLYIAIMGQNYPNINWQPFQKKCFLKSCSKFDIILSHVMISDNAQKKKLWGFKVSNGKKNHPRRGLGLQAFGLGGDHCEGRLFSWSLDRGGLGLGVCPSKALDRRVGMRRESLQEFPPPKQKQCFERLKFRRKWGNKMKQIQMKNKKYMEISGDFSHGKKNGRWFLRYYRDYCTHHPLKFPWTKKSFKFSRQGLGGIRWWWSASQRQCTLWTLCADQLHWQCLYLCPQGICGTNQVRIFADFCWVRFLDGILFWGG